MTTSRRIITILLICLRCTPAVAGGSSPEESRYVTLSPEVKQQQQQQRRQHQGESISRNETNEYITDKSLPSLDFMLQEENDLASASSSSSLSTNDQEKTHLRTSAEIAGYELQAKKLASILAEQEREKIEKRALKSSLRKRNRSFELEIQELERQLEELERMAGRA